MLINLSNHPSADWNKEQLEQAGKYGNIIDLPFPEVEASEDEAYISRLAQAYLDKITDLTGYKSATVHIMGEMTLTFAMVKRLQAAGYTCIASSAQRVVQELPNHKFLKTFRFVRFRQYE